MVNLDDVRLLKLPCHEDPRGLLFPIEFSSLPFIPERIFYVTEVSDRKLRGEHSHYKTSQVLICVIGECRVICKDGLQTKEWVLKKGDDALLIPSMIWDEQIYSSKDTVLLVLANTSYDKLDYIEDWEEYCKIMDKIRGNNVL